MVDNVVVEVHDRSTFGKNAARRMRRDGRVPAVVYGLGLDPYPIAVAPRRIEHVLRLETGVNTIFKLSLDGKQAGRAVMIREIQRDPVTEDMVHIDFVRVDLDKPVQVHVPLMLEGTPEGVREGGMLEMLHRTLHVESLPANIPDGVHYDVSAMQIGDQLSLSDLTAPEGVTLLDAEDTVLASVYVPKVVEEPTEEEAAAAEGDEPVEGAEAAEGDSSAAPAGEAPDA